MAYINQYEVDMARQAKMDQGLNMALQGFQGMESNRRRALEEKRSREAQAIQLAQSGATLEDIKKFQDGNDSSGVISSIAKQSGFERLRKQEAADLDKKVAQSTIARNEAEVAEKSKPFEESREGQAYKAKAQIEQDIRNQNAATDMQKDIQKDFTKKNVQLASVKTAMDAALAQLNDPNKSEEEKVKVGQGLLKLLNSAEGSDAVGAEESKRIGGYLEYQRGNLFEPGKFWGRDMNGFISQVKNNSDLLGDRIRRNEETAKGVSSGRSFTEVVGQPQPIQVAPQIQQKIQQYTPEQKAARLLQLRNKQQQAAMR